MLVSYSGTQSFEITMRNMHIMKITHPTCNLVHNINHRETCDGTPLGGFNNHFERLDFISSIITKEWMFSLVVVLHPINLVILG